MSKTIARTIGRIMSLPIRFDLHFLRVNGKGQWTTPTRKSSYGGHDDVPRITMNELPIPEGSWAAYHKKQNQKYNTQLFVGVSFFCFTLFCMDYMKVVKIGRMPKLPTDDELCLPPIQKKC